MKSGIRRLAWTARQNKILKNAADRARRVFSFSSLPAGAGIIKNNPRAMRVIHEFKKKAGDLKNRVLFIHSSMDGLKMDVDGLRDLIDLFFDWAGGKGNVLMPSFSYSLGQRRLKGEKVKFDISSTPAETGIIPELYRRNKEVLRSLHPTHSVIGRGYLVEEIINLHHSDIYPFGERSPFFKIAGMEGVIIGLGVDWYRCLTSIHVAEDLMKENYPKSAYIKGPLVFDAFDKEGKDRSIKSLVHDNRIYRYMNLLKLRRYLIKENVLEEIEIDGIPMFIVRDAGRLDKAAICLAEKGITIYG